MRRRRHWRVALLATAVAAAIAVVLLPPAPYLRLTRDRLDQVRGGMSRAEVHSILGPPGDYLSGAVQATGSSQFSWMGDWPPRRTASGLADAWETDTALVVVFFGERGAQEVYFKPQRLTEQGPLDHLVWRGKRLWRRWFP